MLPIRRWFRTIQACAASRWYLPFISTLAGLDAFILVVSPEAFIIPGVMVQPQRWKAMSLWVAFGSALGATSFAWVTALYGHDFLTFLLPGVTETEAWTRSLMWMQSYGMAAIAVIAASPIPQHPVVAIAGLSQVSSFKIFSAVLVGRSLKYLLLAWFTRRSLALVQKKVRTPQ